jgi:hypothetical protein
MKEAVRLNADAAESTSDEAHGASLPRCEHVLELCLRTAGIPLPKLSECWPMIPSPCSAIVCVPR